METINIVLTSSEYYAPYTYVLMLSILENTSREIKFYIMTNDMTDLTKDRFEKLKEKHNFEIEYVAVDTKDYPLPKQQRANAIVYSKMNLPKFIPDLKKCLVFDSDIIVKIDVGEIYDIDLGDNYVAWVPDQIDVTLKKESYWLDNFNMSKDKQYINSGVLLLNLEAYKKDNIEQKLIENYEKFKDDILFFDQDLFYITLSDKCIYLDYEYNYLSQLPYTDSKLKERLKETSKIIHYGADLKPWFYPLEEQAEVWWSYARKTPFYEEILKRMTISGIALPPPPKNIVKSAITSFIGNTKSYKTLLREKQKIVTSAKNIYTKTKSKRKDNLSFSIYSPRSKLKFSLEKIA